MSKNDKFKIEADVVKLTAKDATRIAKSVRKDRYAKPDKGTTEKIYDIHYINVNNKEVMFVPGEDYLVTVKKVSFVMKREDIFPDKKSKK